MNKIGDVAVALNKHEREIIGRLIELEKRVKVLEAQNNSFVMDLEECDN